MKKIKLSLNNLLLLLFVVVSVFTACSSDEVSQNEKVGFTMLDFKISSTESQISYNEGFGYLYNTGKIINKKLDLSEFKSELGKSLKLIPDFKSKTQDGVSFSVNDGDFFFELNDFKKTGKIINYVAYFSDGKKINYSFESNDDVKTIESFKDDLRGAYNYLGEDVVVQKQAACPPCAVVVVAIIAGAVVDHCNEVIQQVANNCGSGCSLKASTCSAECVCP
ncbi:MAG: hypothetical protein ACPG45_06440 [Flavobacteriaceae bacterium]